MRGWNRKERRIKEKRKKGANVEKEKGRDRVIRIISHTCRKVRGAHEPPHIVTKG